MIVTQKGGHDVLKSHEHLVKKTKNTYCTGVKENEIIYWAEKIPSNIYKENCTKLFGNSMFFARLFGTHHVIIDLLFVLTLQHQVIKGVL